MSQLEDLHRVGLQHVIEEAENLCGVARRIADMAQEVIDKGGSLEMESQTHFLWGAVARFIKDAAVVRHLQQSGARQRKRMIEPNHVAGAKAFARDQRGAAAVEFAMVGVPFFLLLFGILGVAMMIFEQYRFELAVNKAMRAQTVGAAASAPYNEGQVRSAIESAGFPSAHLTLDPPPPNGKLVTVHASFDHGLAHVLPDVFGLGNLRLDSTVSIYKGE